MLLGERLRKAGGSYLELAESGEPPAMGRLSLLVGAHAGTRAPSLARRL